MNYTKWVKNIMIYRESNLHFVLIYRKKHNFLNYDNFTKILWKICKKILAILVYMLYNHSCCDIDSVEAWGCCSGEQSLEQVFRGANVNFRKMATSHCTKFIVRFWMNEELVWAYCGSMRRNTRTCVQSPLVVR